MNEIESTIRLPAQARPLANYARYYAYVTPDEIMGVYMLPHLDDPPGKLCEQIHPNFSTRTVPCSNPAAEGKEVGANHRVWLSDYHNMPMGDDDKCGSLSFAYHGASHRFEDVSCSGVTSDVHPRPDDVRFYERPRALKAALDSETPVPAIVLLDDHPGSEGPSFILYDDGSAIKATGGGFITAKLTGDAQKQFMRRLNVGALRSLYGGFDISTSSDQASEALLFYVGAKPVFVSVYGSLDNALVRANLPRPIVNAYDTIKSVDLPHARKWLSRKFPHEELWSSENNEVR